MEFQLHTTNVQLFIVLFKGIVKIIFTFSLEHLLNVIGQVIVNEMGVGQA